MISCWPRTILAVAVLLLAPLADHALACECQLSGPPCQAAWTADVVFSGTVRAVERIERRQGDRALPMHVTFNIDRGYLNAPSGLVEVTTGSAARDATVIELKAGDERAVGVVRLAAQ
jgi:hypothetical protein